MSDHEIEIQRLEDEFPSMAAEAFAAARARVLASGQSVVQAEGDALFEVFPDGRKVFLKRIEPAVAVKLGTPIMIR